MMPARKLDVQYWVSAESVMMKGILTLIGVLYPIFSPKRGISSDYKYVAVIGETQSKGATAKDISNDAVNLWALPA